MNKKIDMKQLVPLVLGVVLIVIAVIGIVDIFMDYKKAENKHEQLSNEYVNVNGSVDATTGKILDTKVPWYELITVDMESLTEQYPNTVGWIFFENEEISYPVMKANDNDAYLHMAYDGTYSSGGSIFMDKADTSDFSDAHTILYGHNMKDLSMFGRLKYYKTKTDYYDSHRYFQIHTKTEILRYEIFAYQEISVSSPLYQEEHTSAANVASLLMSSSQIVYDEQITDEDYVITLSTCTDTDENRFVVSAVLVERHSLIEKE